MYIHTRYINSFRGMVIGLWDLSLPSSSAPPSPTANLFHTAVPFSHHNSSCSMPPVNLLPTHPPSVKEYCTVLSFGWQQCGRAPATVAAIFDPTPNTARAPSGWLAMLLLPTVNAVD